MFVSWSTVLFFDSLSFCYLLQLYFHTPSYKSTTCSFDDYHKGALPPHARPMSEAWFFSPFIHKLNDLLLYLARHHSLRPPGGLWAVQLAWELLRRVPVQHDVCGTHLGLAHEDLHLGGAERAHLFLWWVLPFCFPPSRAFLVSEYLSAAVFDLCCCVISFPTFGPTSPWAGLSSSDRKNTILSGKHERTGGDPGSLGDLQAHHPRPLVAHTPFTPPPNTNKSADTPNAHIHASPFLAAPIASLHSRRASAAPCFTLFCD